MTGCVSYIDIPAECTLCFKANKKQQKCYVNCVSGRPEGILTSRCVDVQKNYIKTEDFRPWKRRKGFAEELQDIMPFRGLVVYQTAHRCEIEKGLKCTGLLKSKTDMTPEESWGALQRPWIEKHRSWDDYIFCDAPVPRSRKKNYEGRLSERLRISRCVFLNGSWLSSHANMSTILQEKKRRVLVFFLKISLVVSSFLVYQEMMQCRLLPGTVVTEIQYTVITTLWWLRWRCGFKKHLSEELLQTIKKKNAGSSHRLN